MAWERRRYRRNKVWVEVDPQGAPMLDARGLASLRYKPEDERTYSVRPEDVRALAPPEGADPAQRADPVRIHACGVAAGNPGPAGVGVVLCWGTRRREIQRTLGVATGDEAELTAILTALKAVRRPALPVEIHVDSGYAIGVLEEASRPQAHRRLVQRVRTAMRRFPDLRLLRVPSAGGAPEDERARVLAHAAAHAGGPPPAPGRYHGNP